MDLGSVMDDIGAALETIDGLRVYPYFAQRVSPPAASVGWPTTFDYDETYGRGADSMTLPAIIMVGRVDARTSRDHIAQYADGNGAHSVKTAIDSYDSDVWDAATVTSVEFDVVQVAGVDYLAAEFTIDVYGKGST